MSPTSRKHTAFPYPIPYLPPVRHLPLTPLQSPFCTIRLPLSSYSSLPTCHTTAATLISRSILSLSIHELWGSGPTYPALTTSIRTSSPHLWPRHRDSSFKFLFDSYRGSRSMAAQRDIIESLSWLDFRGPIRLKDAEETFTLFEEYEADPLSVQPAKVKAKAVRDAATASSSLDAVGQEEGSGKGEERGREPRV
ncbi:MAG: hypothetical protein LQ340_006539, partial [Diploschistes diacapsis]